MFNILCEVRKRYGGTYVSLFEDGLVVPWRPLTLDEFIAYSIDQARGLIPAAILEDEIFCKCVTDPIVIQSIDRMKAGVVTTVAGQIWEFSGPHAPAKVNEDLDNARTKIRLPGIGFITELVQQITMVYPAYTPDDIYKMDYETFLCRAALAEDRLFKAGAIEQPFTALAPEDQPQPKSEPGTLSVEERKKLVQEYIEGQSGKFQESPPPQEPPRNIHEYREYIAKHGMSVQAPKPPPLPADIPRDKWWKISPVLEAPKRKPISFAVDNKVAQEGLSGWDLQDLPLNRAKMIEDAQEIYKDLIEEVARRQPKK